MKSPVLRITGYAILALITLSCKPEPRFRSSYEIISPDGGVRAGFIMDQKGNLAYTVHYNNSQLVFPSLLGLEMQEGGFLGKNMEITDVESTSKDETYPVVAGKSSTARDHYQQMRFSLEERNDSQRKLIMEFRAYDDAVAFRYLVPEQESLTDYSVVDEKTTFWLCGSVVLWPMEVGGFHQNYEDHYIRSTREDITDTSFIGLPLSFQVPGILEGSVTEANLDDYPGMYICKDSAGAEALGCRFPPHPERPEVIRAGTEGFSTPWRVIMVAEKLADLIPSNVVMNLNEPSMIEQTEWIRPGLCAWDWWSGPVVKEAGIEAGMNNRTMQYYIDFASEYGLEYMLVDAGWYGDHRSPEADVTSMIPEIDIPRLVEYAMEREVGILLWLNWEHLLPRMDEAFALYRDWGVQGVKIDYMDRDDQEMVNIYSRMIESAAEHELVVDLHGAYKPAGIRRTWPNLMTREGVLGLEYLKWSDLATPLHNVTIPFTRMLTGPMDYTPGGFDQVPADSFQSRGTDPMVPGTRCHQLAMYVVYESPLQMVSDHPEAYRGEPGSEFLKVVPASWDETLALEGEIGKYILLARRLGDDWYLGGMTGEESRDVEVPLSFLSDGERYHFTLYSDSEESQTDPKSLMITDDEVTSGSAPLKVSMAPGGGMAAVFRLLP
ncbi:MAG: glycoside hydrolase family 97 protein [Bacteroidota bacterium]